MKKTEPNSDAWTLASARLYCDLPFNDLLPRHRVHRADFGPNRVQLNKLLNIKTGGCRRFVTIAASQRIMPRSESLKLVSLDTVLEEAQQS